MLLYSVCCTVRTVCVVLCAPCCMSSHILSFSHPTLSFSLLSPPLRSPHPHPPFLPSSTISLSSGSKIWAAHPEWQLKDDSGKVIMHGAPVMDARQPAFRAFWVGHLVNLTKVVDPKTGKPLIDMIYCDGMDGTTPPTPLTGLTPAESEAYYQGTSLSTQRVPMF